MKIILTVILVIILDMSTKRIVYEKIELVRPDHRVELLADLEERTGLKIKRISIGKINFLKDTADITIHYDSPRHDGWDNHEEPVMAVFSSADLDDYLMRRCFHLFSSFVTKQDGLDTHPLRAIILIIKLEWI